VSAGLEAKLFLIGILSLTAVNTVTSLTEVGSRKSFRGQIKTPIHSLESLSSAIIYLFKGEIRKLIALKENGFEE